MSGDVDRSSLRLRAVPALTLLKGHPLSNSAPSKERGLAPQGLSISRAEARQALGPSCAIILRGHTPVILRSLRRRI